MGGTVHLLTPMTLLAGCSDSTTDIQSRDAH
jgi:hypothetical protein